MKTLQKKMLSLAKRSCSPKVSPNPLIDRGGYLVLHTVSGFLTLHELFNVMLYLDMNTSMYMKVYLNKYLHSIVENEFHFNGCADNVDNILDVRVSVKGLRFKAKHVVKFVSLKKASFILTNVYFFNFGGMSGVYRFEEELAKLFTKIKELPELTDITFEIEDFCFDRQNARDLISGDNFEHITINVLDVTHDAVETFNAVKSVNEGKLKSVNYADSLLG